MTTYSAVVTTGINARTDVFLFEVGKPGERLDDVLARAAAYAEAGADSLFVPGLLDLGTLATLTSKSSLPVNVMAGPGAPDVAALRALAYGESAWARRSPRPLTP